MSEAPREYDKEWTVPIGSRARRRTGITTGGGEVARFVVQLEYLVNDEWLQVVRYDHDPASDHGHDVAEKGLHMDVYRDGEQHRREWGRAADAAGRRARFRRRPLTREPRTVHYPVRNMAQHHQGVTDAEIERAREELAGQRAEIHAFLAEQLGGEPEDYDAERYFTQEDDA